MDSKLAEALIARNLLPAGTEVRAKHLAMGLGSVNNVMVSSDFSIAGHKIKEDGSIVFRLADLRSGAPSNVDAEAIEDIDGMDPVRYAAVWDITSDGGKAVVGKRRGRKPKDRSIKIEAE